MIVRHKKPFSLGVVFAISFLGVLLMIFSPIFGDSKNGLQYADDSFNKLAKGSSYFIPKVAKSNEKFMGKAFTVSINMNKEGDKPGDAEKRAELASKLYTAAGAKAEIKGAELKIEGDLGKVLESALQDADSMFKNDGEKIKARYGVDDEKKMFRQWHNTLSKIVKALQKDKKVEDANIVSDVTKKAVEPAYNFYQVDANKVADHAGMMSGLLIFYVVYTMWWGFSIFYMFEGIGLSMKKAKVKKEV